MNGFKGQYTSIKDISAKRRLPRLGKVRLGFKAKTKADVEYPQELPFFTLPPEVAEHYGFKDATKALERAKQLGATREGVLSYIAKFYGSLAEELEVMFPLNDRESVFPQAYKWYGLQRGLRCMGNGETALRGAAYMDELATPTGERTGDGGMVEIQCPCAHLKTEENPKGDCVRRATLSFMIPKVSIGGVYQIDLSSYNSMVDVNSGIDYVAALTQGRFAMLLLKLRRVPTVTHYTEKKGEEAKKQTHWTLQVILDAPAGTLNELIENSRRVFTDYALPPPDDVSPAADTPPEGVVLIEQSDVVEDMRDNPPVGSPVGLGDGTEGAIVEQMAEADGKTKDVLATIVAARTTAELQDVWRSVMATAGDYTKKGLQDLTAAKDKRKKELATKR